jgi:5-methylcytosine-specific restriction endonuclease McrBC GTP-binding regulatory subunit McrB
MNLSHVERYFADLLSLIESDEATELYRPVEDEAGEKQLRSNVNPELRLPPNLFIIGTVNVDETTYMFSPKVLDRANVIEFRMDRNELASFLAEPKSPVFSELNGQGKSFGASFVSESDRSLTTPKGVSKLFEAEALLFFDLLRAHNAEFGFRVANETARFLHFYRLLENKAEDSKDWFDQAMDAIIVQKILPKLHGSRSKMEGLLWALAWACGAKRDGKSVGDFLKECLEAGKAQDEGKFSPEKVVADLGGGKARYPLSFEKVIRMWEKLKRDQFVNFSDA